MKKAFRAIGLLEALSFLLLLLVAMPLKHHWGMREATQVPGMLHGLLFMAYVGLATALATEESWPRRKLWLAYAASVLPLGTLFYDRKFFRG